MPFFQSMAVRFGVKNLLESYGIDEETAGWVAAGASLVTAVVSADLHGHLAGEAASHAISHAGGHIASHGASHVVSHGTSHVVSHGTSHAVSHGTGHAVSHGTNHLATQRDGTAHIGVMDNDVFQDNAGRIANLKEGQHVIFNDNNPGQKQFMSDGYKGNVWVQPADPSNYENPLRPSHSSLVDITDLKEYNSINNYHPRR